MAKRFSRTSGPRARVVLEPNWRQFVTAFLRVLEEKDPYTRGHSQRVQSYVDLLVSTLGWRPYDRQCASIAALLHDIGKVVVERSTIDNHSPFLTPAQRSELIDHPYHGAQIVAGLFPQPVVLGILQHHERMDGNVEHGTFPAYPFGTPGKDIHPIARCIAICDAFDAMTTKRSYNNPISKSEALALLHRDAGSRFDAGILRMFARIAKDIVVTQTASTPGI